MRCVIAKMNLVLMNKAIEHYLDKTKRTETPVFTFLSLWSDEEPYLLTELLFCLDERIETLESEFKANPTEPFAAMLSVLKRKRHRLLQVQGEHSPVIYP